MLTCRYFGGAVGCQVMISGDMIKIGAVVIDVGMNRMEDKKLLGDVNFKQAEKIAAAIPPSQAV